MPARSWLPAAFLLAFACLSVAGSERVISELKSGAERWELVELAGPSLLLRHTPAAPKAGASIALATKPGTTTIHAGLRAELSTSDSALLSVSLKGSEGAVQNLAIWVAKPSDGAAQLANEFSILSPPEKNPLGAKSSQSFAAGPANALVRQVHRTAIEECAVALDCGCCKALQTRTIETVEEETLAWDAQRRTVEKVRTRKWYIVQPGEGLMAVCRKAFGDPTRLGALYRLNPELQRKQVLAEGQRILIEHQGAR